MSQINVDAIRASNGTGDAISLTASSNTCTANITNYPHRNALINGGMQVSQYASTNSAINTYGPLDRWRTIGGPMGFTISQVTDGTNYPNTHTALKAHRTEGNTQEYDLGVLQGIETLNSRPFAGKQCTFSFRARVGANFSGPSSVLKAFVWTGTGTDDQPASMTNHNSSLMTDITVSTTATKYSVTYTIPSSVTQISCGVYYQCRGTAGANDWFEITDCQFEAGPVATDFEIRDYGAELAKCQRYFHRIEAGNGHVVGIGGAALDASNMAYDVIFPVSMRAIPTYEGSATAMRFAANDDSDERNFNQLSIWNTGTVSGVSLLQNSSGGATGGQSGHLQFRANDGFMNFSAEL